MNNLKRFLITRQVGDDTHYWSTDGGGHWNPHRKRAREYKRRATAEQLAQHLGGQVVPLQDETPPAQGHSFKVSLIIDGVAQFADRDRPFREGYDYFLQIQEVMTGLEGDLGWRLNAPTSGDGQAIGEGTLTGIEAAAQLDAYHREVRRRMGLLPYEFRYQLALQWVLPIGWPADRLYGGKPDDACKWCGRSAKRIGDGQLHDGYCDEHKGMAVGRPGIALGGVVVIS